MQQHRPVQSSYVNVQNVCHHVDVLLFAVLTSLCQEDPEHTEGPGTDLWHSSDPRGCRAELWELDLIVTVSRNILLKKARLGLHEEQILRL